MDIPDFRSGLRGLAEIAYTIRLADGGRGAKRNAGTVQK